MAPGKFELNFIYVIFKNILVINSWGISCKIALIWMSLDLSDDQSTLFHVMAWCRQATSHYLSQCWPRSPSPYGVTRPRMINTSVKIFLYSYLDAWICILMHWWVVGWVDGLIVRLVTFCCSWLLCTYRGKHASTKLRLCSANHRSGYWSNLPCDWPSTAWAYSGQETENGPWWWWRSCFDVL